MKSSHFISLFSVLALAFAMSPAQARETSLSVDTSLLGSGSDYSRIAIVLLKGSVRVTRMRSAGNFTPSLRVSKSLNEKNPSSESLKHYEQLGLSVRKDGSTIVLESTGPSSKSDDSDWLKPGQPELKIDLGEVRAVPIDIFVRDGNVDVEGNSQSASVTVVDGQIRANDGSGSLRLSVQKGEIHVEGTHAAHIEIDATSARVVALKNDGALTIGNLAGETTVVDHKGAIDLKTFSGATTVSKSSGSLDISLGKGALNVTNFEGPLRGQSDQAPVVATLLGESEVNLETDQGAVNLKLPSDSGASVQAQSEEGSVQAPSPLKPVNGNSRFWGGRLTGNSSRGSVVVRSKSGSIRIH